MLHRLLTDQDATLVADEREWLGRLQTLLARFDQPDDVRGVLARSIRQLDQLFLLVIVGEFNAGKSAFINALLGATVAEEGVTPTTTRIQKLVHGAERQVSHDGAQATIAAPVDVLRDITIVDTPGTNAIFREHEAITSEFVPQADLVIFVTSADRPFTESERGFLERIRDWGKKIVVVVNKVDILESAADAARVEAFVTDSIRALLGVTPEVFLVSARHALRRKTGERAAPHPSDRFDALERFVFETLDERARLQLKLLNPIGVGLRLLTSTQDVVRVRQELLRDDTATIDDVEQQLGMYEEDLDREFRYRLADVDRTLHAFEGRGIEFFDDTLRLPRLFDLLNADRLKADYERKVVADTPRTIEKSVEDLIDWLVASDLRQWQAVSQRLQARRVVHADRIVGELGGTFTNDRARLIDTVGRAAERAVDGYDREREARDMADSVRMAVAGTAIAQAGAVGLGAAVSFLASTTFADVTGILAASAIAVLGLFVIPMRRQQAKKQLRAKIGTMRHELMSALNSQFEREVERGMRRIRDSIAPYTRFVRAEQTRLGDTHAELEAIGGGLSALKARIEALASEPRARGPHVPHE